jgi:hypothetical protein
MENIQSNKEEHRPIKYKYTIKFIQKSNIPNNQGEEIEVVSELKKESLEDILFNFQRVFNSLKKSKEEKQILINNMLEETRYEHDDNSTTMPEEILEWILSYIQNYKSPLDTFNLEIISYNIYDKLIRTDKRSKLYYKTKMDSIKKRVKTIYFDINYIVVKAVILSYCARNLIVLTNDFFKWVALSQLKSEISKEMEKQKLNAEQENEIKHNLNELEIFLNEKLSKEELQNLTHTLNEDIKIIMLKHILLEYEYESIEDSVFKNTCKEFHDQGSNIIDKLELSENIKNGLFKGIIGLYHVKKDIDFIRKMYNEIGFNEVKENLDNNNYEKSIIIFNNCLEKLFEKVPVEYTEYNKKYNEVMVY